MRILFVFHFPPRRELGVSRGILDVVDAMRAKGHTVSTLTTVDILPTELFPRYPWRDGRRTFARRARRYVRRHARDFDVIDALEGSLPWSKEQLDFDGVLVTNTAGLVELYAEYVAYERRRWRDRLPGTRLGQAVHSWRWRRYRRDAHYAIRSSDVVRVLNGDEERWLTNALPEPRRILLMPLGLSEARREDLQRAAGSAGRRLSLQTVLFIGTWTLRKGSADIRSIVQSVTRRVPGVQFHFAGTYVDSQVRAELQGSSESIQITPTYRHDELPDILANATVLMAPSYVEGFHLGVLESLAAGVPTVAYDAPGPRFMLSRLPERRLLIPLGDTGIFADRLVEILTMSDADYDALAQECRTATDDLRVEDLTSRLEDRVRNVRQEVGDIS